MTRCFSSKSFLLALLLFTAGPLYGIDTLPQVIKSAEISHMITPEKRSIRYAHWKSQGKEQPYTIVIFQGRASFIEKHSEFVQDLLKRGYEVFAFDWTGQGGSTRLLDHPQKGHIDTYETFTAEAHQLIEKVIKAKTSKPVVIFGSSMGGHIALRHMLDYPGDVKGAVLLSPMNDIPTKPFPKWSAKPLMAAANALGFGDFYVPGYGDFDPKRDVFERAKNTSDEQRFLRQRQYTIDYPEYKRGGPTIGWVAATFRSLDHVEKDGALESIEVPILLMNAGQDTAVLNHKDGAFCERLPKCRLVTYKDSKHNIVVERDSIRNQFWKDFDDFMEKLNTPQPKHIYKILARQDWEREKDNYKGNDWDQKDGFIHVSQAHQVERIAKKYFSGQKDLILLKVPYEKVVGSTKWEPNSKGDLFPHIYGAFTHEDVVEEVAIDPETFPYSSLEN